MKYTLIAFKPEESNWYADEKEVYPASLIRENDLSREDVIRRIFELSRKPEFINNTSRFNSDCPYEEFHVLKFHEEFDEITLMIDEGLELAYEFNKKGEKRRKEQVVKEKEEKNKKELEVKKVEYEKLKLLFEK